MKKFAGISGIFFLCIYSMILMHNVLPHHHEADHVDLFTASASQTHHHHETHHHSHHHHHDDAEDLPGFFDFFLDFLGGLDVSDKGEGQFSMFVGTDAIPQLKVIQLFPLVATTLERLVPLAESALPRAEIDEPPPKLRPHADLIPLRGPPHPIV